MFLLLGGGGVFLRYPLLINLTPDAIVSTPTMLHPATVLIRQSVLLSALGTANSTVTTIAPTCVIMPAVGATSNNSHSINVNMTALRTRGHCPSTNDTTCESVRGPFRGKLVLRRSGRRSITVHVKPITSPFFAWIPRSHVQYCNVFRRVRSGTCSLRRPLLLRTHKISTSLMQEHSPSPTGCIHVVSPLGSQRLLIVIVHLPPSLIIHPSSNISAIISAIAHSTLVLICLLNSADGKIEDDGVAFGP